MKTDTSLLYNYFQNHSLSQNEYKVYQDKIGFASFGEYETEETISSDDWKPFVIEMSEE